MLFLSAPAGFQVVNWFDKSRDAKDKAAALDTAKAELDRLTAEHKAAQDAAKKALTDATAAEQEVTAKYRAEMQAARKLLEDRDFSVRLTGPAHVQPGAPNRWVIETVNRQGEVTTPKKLEVVVKDRNDAVLLKQTHEQPGAATPLELPLAFWQTTKPGAELFLEVAALAADERKGILNERIPLARPVYVTHLQTDKPLYRPGETIRFRSLTLDRASLQPPPNDQFLKFKLARPGRRGHRTRRPATAASSATCSRCWGRTGSRSAASALANTRSRPTHPAASTNSTCTRRTARRAGTCCWRRASSS